MSYDPSKTRTREQELALIERARREAMAIQRTLEDAHCGRSTDRNEGWFEARNRLVRSPQSPGDESSRFELA